MTATRNGVYHTLSESPWKYRYGGVTFYFASKKHYDAFAARLDPSVEKMGAEMLRRSGVHVDMGMVAALQLYRRCETFGFYIESPDGSATEPGQVAVGPGRVDLN